MKVAAIQHDIVWEDAPATRANVTPMIAAAAAGGAELIVLSEMFATGFSMNPERIAEDEGGPNESFLREQAQRHQAWLMASIAQRVPSGGYANNAVVAGPAGELERYAKIHPFSYAGEHERYVAGTHAITVRIGELRMTPFICYDLRFADEFWAMAHDTDLFVVPANWPEPRIEHWRTLLRARAIENQCYVLGVNRVGAAGSLNHVGASALIDPLGRTLAEAMLGEGVVAGEVSAAEVARVRAEFPFLADRR